MANFSSSEWIKESPEVVFNFMTDPGHASKAMHNVVKLEKLSPGPIQAGTKLRETRRVRGKEHQAELEVVACQPPQRYSVAAEQSGIRVIYHYTLSPERQGTRIDLACEITASGLKKLMIPLVAAIMKKEDGNHLQQLKSALENQLPSLANARATA